MILVAGRSKARVCEQKDCEISARYNYEGLRLKRFCGKHRLPGMTNIAKRLCQSPNCKTQPSCNFPGEKSAIFCSRHKLAGMIQTHRSRKRCTHDGCKVGAMFNFAGQKPGIYCSKHRLSGMVDVVSRKCRVEGCANSAYYKEDGQKPKHCATHKLPGMKIVRRNRVCEHTNCTTTAAFNYEGEKLNRFCEAHKLPEMVKNKIKYYLCESKSCQTLASFNYPTETKLRFCLEHRLPGMVNVRKNGHLCQQDGCTRFASFCVSDGKFKRKSKRFCALHRLPDMHKITTSQRCQSVECTKWASFNYPQETARKYCKAHKLPGMVRRSSQNMCRYSGCTTVASFNYEGQKARYCLKHKHPDMISVKKMNPKCHHDNCSAPATFNFEGQPKGIYCQDHHLKGMVLLQRDGQKTQQKMKCQKAGCVQIAVFGINSEGIATYCLDHKSEELPDLGVHPVCLLGNCKVPPTFNFPGARFAGLCVAHKLDGMVDVTRKEVESEQTIPKPSALNHLNNLQSETCQEQGNHNDRPAHDQQLNESLVHMQSPSQVIQIHNNMLLNNQVVERAQSSKQKDLPANDQAGQDSSKFIHATTPFFQIDCPPTLALELSNTQDLEQLGSILKSSDISQSSTPACVRGNCERNPRFNHEGTEIGALCIEHKMEGMIDVMKSRVTVPCTGGYAEI